MDEAAHLAAVGLDCLVIRLASITTITVSAGQIGRDVGEVGKGKRPWRRGSNAEVVKGKQSRLFRLAKKTSEETDPLDFWNMVIERGV